MIQSLDGSIIFSREYSERLFPYFATKFTILLGT